MRTIWTGLLGLLLATPVAAQLFEQRVRPWSEVESIQSAPGTLEYTGENYRTWLSRDGRMTTTFELPPKRAASLPPQPAVLGTWRAQGAWLEVSGTHMAYRTPAEFEQAKEAWKAQLVEAAAAAGSDEERKYYESFLDGTAEVPDEAQAAEHATQRYLRVPHAGGDLLLSEWSVEYTAKRWDGKGPLKVRPEAWRAGMAPDAKSGAFEIAHPLSAGLPIELAGLLRRDTIHGSVVEVLDTADTLEWKFNYATVRVKLDRGANHGLYEKMDLYGLPPDEAFFAQVGKLEPESAVAEISVTRFAPGDPVALPVRGLRFATRRDAPEACGVDTSVALRGKVLALAPLAGNAKVVDYHSYRELDIDLGKQHGLMVGDRFTAEADGLEGEGRVERMQGDRATVLWRVMRADEDDAVRWPAPGDALVTPAWKRAAEDTFGSPADE